MTRKLPGTWLTETCPICGREYQYLIDHKPETCSNGECSKENYHRRKRLAQLDNLIERVRRA
jgi:hypothetical protein